LNDFATLEEEHGANTKEVYYFFLRQDQNTADSAIKAKFNQAMEVANKLQNELVFFSLSLTKLPKEKRELFLQSNLLKPFHRYFEMLFKTSDFVLSEPEEKICTLKRETALEAWSSMLGSLMEKESYVIHMQDGTTQAISFE